MINTLNLLKKIHDEVKGELEVSVRYETPNQIVIVLLWKNNYKLSHVFDMGELELIGNQNAHIDWFIAWANSIKAKHDKS